MLRRVSLWFVVTQSSGLELTSLWSNLDCVLYVRHPLAWRGVGGNSSGMETLPSPWDLPHSPLGLSLPQNSLLLSCLPSSFLLLWSILPSLHQDLFGVIANLEIA